MLFIDHDPRVFVRYCCVAIVGYRDRKPLPATELECPVSLPSEGYKTGNPLRCPPFSPLNQCCPHPLMTIRDIVVPCRRAARLYERCAVSLGTNEYNVSGKALPQLANLTGKPARKIFQGLPTQEMNHE